MDVERKARFNRLRIMKSKTSWGFLAALTFLFVFVTTRLGYEHLRVERNWRPAATETRDGLEMNNLVDSSSSRSLGFLPQGILESTSDLELRPLWTYNSRFKGGTVNSTAILAIPVGLKQKYNVHSMVKKFLSANCSVILFHYDGNLDAWNDLEWTNKAIHVVAENQTKWWFAKRFLHPDVVSIYDYVFLWDEDLGVENFDPGRFLQIMASEGLEIAQPALDPGLSEVHHRITIRNKKHKVHRRVYAVQGGKNCSDESIGPPCAGWVEGMAPVFSRAAWRCVWHLIQSDLVHGWGLDMKLGYCAQGDRNEKVGVVDSEYIVHQGIPTLGGPSAEKAPSYKTLDLRTKIRRQSTAELKVFKQRWEKAVNEDDEWVDPFVPLTTNSQS